MKIVQLNLAGRRPDITDRIGEIAKFLDVEQAEVVCLEEVTFSENDNLAEQINKLLRNSYRYVLADLAEEFVGKDGKPTSDGLAILANLEVLRRECLTLQKSPVDERGRPDFHKRIVQVVELENGVKIANLHLASNGNSYLQFRELLGRVTGDYFLTGDFNIHKEKMLGERVFWGEQYDCSIDFCDYVSFSNEKCTFDYLLAPREMKIIGVRAVQGLSDHAAMVYEVN